MSVLPKFRILSEYFRFLCVRKWVRQITENTSDYAGVTSLANRSAVSTRSMDVTTPDGAWLCARRLSSIFAGEKAWTTAYTVCVC